MRISLLITGLLALLLVVSLAACGTNNVGTLGLGSHQTAGVQLGGYEVIRYNANGTADSSLNGTLDLRLDGSDLTVAVRDSEFTSSVLLDVKYNAGSEHPVTADFHGLLGNEDQVLSAAFLTQRAGLAGLGEVAIGSYKPGALNGDAVTVHFAPGALRTVSATGIVYNSGVGTMYEHTAYTPGISTFTKLDPAANDVHATWYCGWARADGNQDGLCNVGDLTPLGIHFGKTIDTTNPLFAASVADYDDNGQVAIGDLSPLGVHFGMGCEQYIVEGSDNHDGDPMNAIATVPFASFIPVPTPAAPSYPDLATIQRSWTIDFTETSTFTYAALQAMDTDTDGTIRLYVTPSYSGPPVTLGIPAYVDLLVPSSGHPVIITGYDIQAVGATGGTGAGTDIFATGGTGGVISNQALTMQLNSVTGTWEGDAFTEAAPYPSGMTAADYDTIKAAVADALVWTFTNQGAAEARYTSPWFVPTAAYPGNGDPGAGFVCPDDDPESSAASREGDCATDLGAGAITCPDPLISISAAAPVVGTFGFDMTPDPVAPIIEGYYTGPDFGSKTLELLTGAGVTTIFFKMTSWGANGTNIPGDGTNCKVQVIQVVDNDASAAPTDLTWYTGAGSDPGDGEFYFYHAPAPLDIDIFICKVQGASLALGAEYALRFYDGTTWSTINLPEFLLTTAPPPPPEDLLTLPKIYGRNFNAPHYLQIFMNEPGLRRDSRIVLNGIDGSIAPKDGVAYLDFLKDKDASPFMEFPVTMKPVVIGGHPGFAPYPTIVIAANTVADPVDPSTLVEGDVRGIADLSIPFVGGRDGGRLTVDITALILNLDPPVPGDPNLKYVYKVFGQTADVGTGKFEIPQEPLELVTPAGAAWGINVGARGTWNKIDFNLNCTNFAVNGTTMKDPTPDVFWVRFNGGTRMLAWDEYWSQSTDNNIKVVFDDITNPAQQEARLSLAVVGITTANDYIAIHHLNRQDPILLNYVDWVHPTIPGGVLNPGDEYNVILDDPTTGSLDYTFTQTMSVTGTNPNF